MNQPIQPGRGSYTANLIGNIKSHLAGLQGYDVMALELIQNADDAKADKIVFDITDKGLLVSNNETFTYCGDLNRQCEHKKTKDYSCDFHRIVDVGSGGKLSQSDNIGRFGIGFVSVYQVTDHPEIRSKGIKLTLRPEEGQWFTEQFDASHGTSFFLPWADDPKTEARLALGLSHVSADHINQLREDFKGVLSKSLLFLRYVQKVEVRQKGNMLLACNLARSGKDESELIVSYEPSGKVEKWHILQTDATESAESLYEKYTQLKSLDRSSKIKIGLRVDPEPLDEGLLYAYLPTEQSTGLPLHINADFFPQSDRKTVIFAGNQHEQAWNEMLIEAAANKLAKDPESLLRMLGDEQLWEILDRAYKLFSQSLNHPPCFKHFWEQLKITATEARITRTRDKSVQRPDDVFFPDSSLNELQAKVFLKMGGKINADKLRPYRTAMNQLGTPILTLERLVSLLEPTMAEQCAVQVEEQMIEDFYRPLWEMVNDLLPKAGSQNLAANPAVQKLKNVPFIITEDLYVFDINSSYKSPDLIDIVRIVELLERLQIASHYLLDYPKIMGLIKQLDLKVVADHINSECASSKVTDVISDEKNELRHLYSLLSDLDLLGNDDQAVYEVLRDLPIWLSSQGLIKATGALLPGDFNDPIGQADLLDPSVLTENANKFISRKIKVQSLTIEAYVQEVLPKFFDEGGQNDLSKYKRLVTELAKHSSLIRDDESKKLLASLPLIPTLDGNWSTPENTYRQTDDLVKVLGEATHLWLDSTRIPDSPAVTGFLNSLGILMKPSPAHLVERMCNIAEKNDTATEDAKKASAEAFYKLCEYYDECKDKESFKKVIAKLEDVECFPADGNDEEWYSATDLYAPFRSDAFKSQASILGFKNPKKLKKAFLEKIGVHMEPKTNLVIDHLRHCVEHAESPHVLTYQVLNERAQNEEEDWLIKQLQDIPCIYVKSQESFFRPNQVYWTAQQLGRFALTIPANYEDYKQLFRVIGVKNEPDAKDFVNILLDIVTEFYERGASIEGPDRNVYDVCLNRISMAYDREELDDKEIQQLQESPSILNVLGNAIFPDELMIHDSEWYAELFGGELDQALCKPAIEQWPLLKYIGVQLLSRCAEVDLDFVDGEKKAEIGIESTLHERVEIIERLLHNKPRFIKKKVAKEFSNLTVVSYEVVRIQATVSYGNNPEVVAPPRPVPAYYDTDQHQLILARPVNDRSWTHLLNALFLQLMPNESMNDIQQLTLTAHSIMEKPVEQGHQRITDAGYPPLEAERSDDHTEDLTSPELGNIGSQSSLDDESDVNPLDSPTDLDEENAERSKDALLTEGAPQSQENEGNSTTQSSTHDQNLDTDSGEQIDSASGGNRDRSTGEGHAKKPHQKHKEQWKKQLLSYVHQKKGAQPSETEGQGNREHNLAVEVESRKAVCNYEKERGRIAEEMSQTNPGYDIISRNPKTEEERIIEVKGVSGEWNETGVELSKTQFSNAQDFGDSYWLYVVEFVFEPEHRRVHPIQNPAKQVTSFMFDRGWRDAVTDERGDPSLSFTKGALVKHDLYGRGKIKDTWLRGTTRILQIEFNDRLIELPLNLHSMKVVESYEENDDGNDNS